MSEFFPAPLPKDDVVKHADYLELLALIEDDRSASIYDLGRDVVQSGALGELPEKEDGPEPPDDVFPADRGGERVQELIRVAMNEIERRIRICGESYPFDLDGRGVLEAGHLADFSVYVFLLLLTSRSSGVIQRSERKLFEEISTEAAAAYLGGGRDVVRKCFGAPRREGSGFVDALRDLCASIGEGSVQPEAEGIANQQDGGVDVVAVKRFPDHRVGQLAIFAQCATGRRWQDKLRDLQPGTFMRLWMGETLAVEPIKAVFVPVAIGEAAWRKVAMTAGIPFDRTRIAYHSEGLPSHLIDELRECNVRSLTELRSG